jgi:hypothetical protein
MREIPPYTMAEIRLLLSQALDSELDAEQMMAVDELMRANPAYQAEFLKLQATRRHIQESCAIPADADEVLAFPHSGILWQRIAGQLNQDEQAQLLNFGPEFISAYLDGEISRSDAEREAFEAQLLQNAGANILIAGLSQVSETVKQFGYRQEKACTLDLAEQVMTIIQSELIVEHVPITDAFIDSESGMPPAEEEWELLSAFQDRALTPRETIAATQQIEASPTARERLAGLNRLSEHLQLFSQRLQESAPDFWPALCPMLEAESHKASTGMAKLFDFSSGSWIKRAILPMAASLLLGLLIWPNLFTGGRISGSLINSATPSGRLPIQGARAEMQNEQDLASVSASSQDIHAVNFDASAESASLIPTVELSTPASAGSRFKAARLKPLLETAGPEISTALTHGSGWDTGSAAAASPRQAPSSDAYLFDALSKQMPDDDISNILGK